MSTRDGTEASGAASARAALRHLRLPVALILVNVLLLAPGWVLFRGFAPWISVEACALVGMFWMLPRRRWSVWAAVVAGFCVVLFSLIGFGDTATRMSLNRPLNLYVDVWLLVSVRDLLVGTFGTLAGWAALMLMGVGAALLGALTAYLLATIGGARSPRQLVASGAGVVAVVLLGLGAERIDATAPQVDFPVTRLATYQSAKFVEMLGERERFADALALVPESYADVPGLFSRLGRSDVLFGFVESYGVSAIRDPRYAPVVGPRLDELEERAEAAGLHLVSGTLVAPSQGGQSWFGHGSMMSGIWLDNQLRYDMMLRSGRETLIDDFERAGYRTVALMPAIISAWPEGRRFGYEEIYTRPEIDYAGPPLNWVTMPDQFTWSFLEHSIREESERPLFAEIAFISSHAPWTPILTVYDDWDVIGDGSIFDAFENAGERPEELWRDYDRVREHYALSIEYAVHAMASYAERFVDDHTLLIVLGDHQPAPLVTGDGASWEVPVHVISGDASLVEPFLEWGFVEGAWPSDDPEREALGVDYFRDWFVRAYSGS